MLKSGAEASFRNPRLEFDAAETQLLCFLRRRKHLTVYHTSRFGELTVDEDRDVIVIPEGVIGFAERKRYVLLEDPDQQPFMWLQSLEEPALAFVTVDPLLFFPDYQVQVPKDDVALLEIEKPEDARVLVIVVVREEASKITANLKGPIVLNPQNRRGKQVVLMDDRYQTQHPLLAQLPETQEI
jgi:flagellar assembly factor FliW